MTTIIEPDAVPAFEKTARACIESLAEFEAINKDEQPLQTMQFLKADPSETEPWKGIMLRNTPGQAPAGAPVFLAQGTADTTVRPEITKQFGDHLCSQGTRVSFVELRGVTIPWSPRTACRPRCAGWVTGSGARRRHQVARARTRAGRRKSPKSE